MMQDHQKKDLAKNLTFLPKKTSSVYLKLSGRRSFNIFLFKNGDRHSRPFRYVINPKKLPELGSVMTELSHSIFCSPSFLPNGVRYMFTLGGQRIDKMEQLQENSSYVCSSTCVFDQLDYAAIEGSPDWHSSSRFVIPRLASSRRRCSKAATKSRINTNKGQGRGRGEGQGRDLATTSRIVHLVAHSTGRPRNIHQFLLNSKTAPFFEKLMGSISMKVALSSGPVKKIYNMDGEEVTTLSQFFDETGVFIVVGNELFTKLDCKLTDLEIKKIEENGKVRSKNQKDATNKTMSAIEQKSNPKVKLETSVPNTNFLYENESRLSDDRILSQLKEKYEVGSVLSQNNFTTIRECYLRDTDNRLILKEIDLDSCPDCEKVDREINILLQLKHDNINAILDVFTTSNQIYLVSELYQDGHILHQLIESMNFCEEDVSGILFHLASALYYLHSKSIVHRHVKLENLMVHSDGNGAKLLKLCDFGLATIAAKGPLTQVCGTPLYMAPEILQETGYWMKVDVWSSGIVAALLLTGKFPHGCYFEDHNVVFNHLMNLKSIQFSGSHWDHVSKPAKTFVKLCLSIDPNKRLSSLEMLEFPWIKNDMLPYKENISPKIGPSLIKLMPIPYPTPLQQAFNILNTTAADKGQNFFLSQS